MAHFVLPSFYWSTFFLLLAYCLLLLFFEWSPPPRPPPPQFPTPILSHFLQAINAVQAFVIYEMELTHRNVHVVQAGETVKELILEEVRQEALASPSACSNRRALTELKSPWQKEVLRFSSRTKEQIGKFSSATPAVCTPHMPNSVCQAVWNIRIIVKPEYCSDNPIFTRGGNFFLHSNYHFYLLFQTSKMCEPVSYFQIVCALVRCAYLYLCIVKQFFALTGY